MKFAPPLSHYSMIGLLNTIVPTSKSIMLKPLRIKAGLRNPPVAYTNNANESANARIKAKVDYKKSDLNVFCNEMKDLS